MTFGFADLHNHQFSYLGYGGNIFWGGAYGDPADVLKHCAQVHGPGGIRDIIGNLMRSIAYGASYSGGHLVGGFPEFDGWPRWDSITHQAVHENWLRRAVDGGLRLMAMLAVHNEGLATKANPKPGSPRDDMGAVDLQLAAAKAMRLIQN